MIGRAGSRGLPGKNTKTILGKSLCEFPLIACKKSKFVKRHLLGFDFQFSIKNCFVKRH